MKVAVDVRYHDDYAVAGVIGFLDWSDEVASFAMTVTSDLAAEYEAGAFYKRELPPVLEALERLPFAPELVVVDAYVDLPEGRPGLGRHLHERTGLPVIGVAKSPFQGAPCEPVLRGSSARPLFVSAAGLTVDDAAEHIRQMYGPHRMPALLQAADRLASHG